MYKSHVSPFNPFGKKKKKTSVCKMVTLSLYFMSVVFVGLHSSMLSAYQLIFLYNFCKGTETKTLTF